MGWGRYPSAQGRSAGPQSSDTGVRLPPFSCGGQKKNGTAHDCQGFATFLACAAAACATAACCATAAAASAAASAAARSARLARLLKFSRSRTRRFLALSVAPSSNGGTRFLFFWPFLELPVATCAELAITYAHSSARARSRKYSSGCLTA